MFRPDLVRSRVVWTFLVRVLTRSSSGSLRPRELAELVHDYFANEGTEVSYDPEQGIGEALGAHYSVHNMASNLALIEPDEWPDFVAWHFRHLKDGPPDIPSEYSEVQKRRKLRGGTGSRT